ncbi:MAG: DNA-binding protein [Propionibacteriales bacterium]|nr:DNA-binding protein [Propionibacteriales bacterium]
MSTRERASAGPQRGSWRRALRRLAPSQSDIEARELQSEVREVGCSRVIDAQERQRVEVAGTLRHVTLRPRSGTPALEAELYDGSGCVVLVWLGRRRIAGIQPGAHVTAEGRISTQDAQKVIYNPRYELRA